MSSFSFSRLGKLITKQLFENARLYTLSILALFGLLALIFTFWFVTDGPTYDERATFIIFILGLFISGTAFASMSFNMLGSKDKGIYWLSIPATHLEKLICAIFYSTIVSTIVYCAVFYIVKTISISLLLEYTQSHPPQTFVPIDTLDGEFRLIFVSFIYGYFALQSIYILGSVYFPRYSFILTTVVGTSIAFAFAFYLSQIDDGMFNNLDWEIVSVKKTDPAVKNSYMFYSVSPSIIQSLKYILQFAGPPIFWVATWLRLREKEI